MWGRQRFGVPIILSWEDAAKVEKTIVPIRGRSEVCKPLGFRRNDYVNIRKTDGDEPAYVCRLYQTDVATYRKSGEVVIELEGWASNTTTKLLSELLLTDVRVTRNRAWMWCEAEVDGKVVDGYYLLATSGPNVLTRSNNRWRLHNPEIMTLHTVNRAGANSVRSRYAQFLKYVIGMTKAHGDMYDQEELWPYSVESVNRPESPRSMMLPTPVNIGCTAHTKNVPMFLELARSADPADNYEALQMMQLSIAYRVVGGKYCAPVYSLKGVLDTALMHYYFTTWFTPRPAPQGKIVHDKYAKYLT